MGYEGKEEGNGMKNLLFNFPHSYVCKLSISHIVNILKHILSFSNRLA